MTALNTSFFFSSSKYEDILFSTPSFCAAFFIHTSRYVDQIKAHDQLLHA